VRGKEMEWKNGVCVQKNFNAEMKDGLGTEKSMPNPVERQVELFIFLQAAAPFR
jgi:hypothetical protein